MKITERKRPVLIVGGGPVGLPLVRVVVRDFERGLAKIGNVGEA